MNIIYTDGSCNLNVPSAGAGVFFEFRPEWNISCSVPGRQTNQRAELYAIYKALQKMVQESDTKTDDPAKCCTILSDSLYSIRVATKQWRAKTNLDLIRPIWDCINTLKKKQWDIRWRHVRGHTGIRGNEIADDLANQARKKYEETLLDGLES